MSTQAQVTANQQNAQLSTGPVTPAGSERSSRNATKHGLTGQTLVISPEEREAYEAHVQSYMDHHKPIAQEHRQLVQQLADAHWSVHQAFVLQTNAIALINAISIQMSASGDPVATAAALAPATRQLNTYSIYEGRRRRAAKAIQEELDAFEQELADLRRNANKPNPQPEIGSVCSTSAPVPTQAAEQEALAAWKRDMDAMLRQCESEVTPAEAAAIRRQAAKMSR
jgi:hypothetical protein